MPAMAGEAYLAPGQGDVEARKKKVDQVEGAAPPKIDVRSRLIDAERQPILSIRRLRLTERNPALDRPCGDKLST
jgi:hypothetical protein